MPRNEERTNQTANNDRAFPENVEPHGATRFGPAPTKPKPTTTNVNNVDPHGRKSPTFHRS